jgi:enoyl-CoA hydratase/carnithine racemase
MTPARAFGKTSKPKRREPVSEVLYEKRNRIAYITLNRPQKLNAIDRVMNRLLHEIWVDYNGRRNMDRVICYTWEGKRGGPSGDFEEAASAVV